MTTPLDPHKDQDQVAHYSSNWYPPRLQSQYRLIPTKTKTKSLMTPQACITEPRPLATLIQQRHGRRRGQRRPTRPRRRRRKEVKRPKLVTLLACHSSAARVCPRQAPPGTACRASTTRGCESRTRSRCPPCSRPGKGIALAGHRNKAACCRAPAQCGPDRWDMEEAR
ncbi:uncharacterized protein UV8b_06857 [Ustilaginoidea virens]|uniref:Uncharacterized protein n=1 Tax=Ustilaginoidea virens TaxID=1159556 RepID=A0A8E5HW21_USTVR|nr:uncharacterized protein UV8b_06857 [Ustilaginoidea virens]QUC22616.1 hypothetical protein UV8b_06857 [Ustilaginoidea virens]